MSQQLSAGISLALAQRGGGGQPSLALNFLTEQLDPRITFTRGTPAMRYGQDGTLQYGPHNLLTYSNQADNAAWTKSNSFVQTNLLTFSDAAVANYANISGTVVNTTPITGFTNSVRFPDNSATIVAYKSYTITINTLYTISAYVQMDDGSAPILSFSSLTGDLALVVDNNPANLNLTVTSVGNGVYRVSAGYTTNAFTGTNIGVVKYNTQSARGFKVTGLQLVQGSVPGDYRATTSAALPVLYADYQGNLRARKVCENSATADHYIVEGAGVIGNTETISVHAKAGERNWLALQLGGSSAAYFNLSTGVKGTVVSGTSTISSAGNGYYRCTLSAVRAGTTNTLIYAASADSVVTYAGDGSSGIYIADAQLVQGYLPLPVVETTSAAIYNQRLDYNPASLVTQNLLLYSEQFDNAVWSKLATGTGVAPVVTPNYAAAPDGTLTADRIVFDRGAGTTSSDISYINQTITSVPVDCTGGIWLRTTDGSTKSITFRVGNTFNYTVSVTGTWTQFTLTGTAPITRLDLLAYGDRAVQITDLLVWGGQLNRGSTALPYARTTSATTQTCAVRGTLVEEARTNLATYSNTFSDASWVASGAKNVVASAVLSPEGVANAWTLTDSSAVAFEGIQKNLTVAADGTTYTASVFILKTYGGTSPTFGINLGISGGTTVSVNARFNSDTGAVLSGTATVTDGGAYWRLACPITNNSSVGNTNLSFALFPATAAYNTALDSAAATGSATIYQAQLEVGAFATSPIITVGSTVTRNGDNMSMPAPASWFNSTQGTLYAEADTLEPAILGARTIVAINDGTASNFHRLVSYNGKIGGGTNTAGVLVADLQPLSYTVNTTFKFAYSYAANDFAAVGNGGSPLTDNLGALPTGLNTMGIGLLSGVFWCGHLRTFKFYRRKYSTTELQRLTA